jgi:secondary thiamine-phosphate synthase enzyme
LLYDSNKRLSITSIRNVNWAILYTKASPKHSFFRSPERFFNKTLKFHTNGEIDFIELSDEVKEVSSNSGIKKCIVHVFAPHATGVLILTENDAALLEDIKAFLEEIAPRRQDYQHPSNAHAHLRSMVLPPDKTLPLIEGEVAFGTWQSLLYVETDVYPRERTLIVQVMGE